MVLGFHGCDQAVGERVLAGDERHLRPSSNDYDWLGPGVYFWEADPWRAMAFAKAASERRHLTRGRITKPFVIGAVLDLGRCCNLLEIDAINETRQAYQYLEAAHAFVDELDKMPVNRGPELGLRNLDKAVIDVVHRLRRRRRMPAYDTVRAAFIEGEELYPKAGFRAKNHIQLAVRNTDCILGYFRLPGL